MQIVMSAKSIIGLFWEVLYSLTTMQEQLGRLWLKAQASALSSSRSSVTMFMIASVC